MTYIAVSKMKSFSCLPSYNRFANEVINDDGAFEESYRWFRAKMLDNGESKVFGIEAFCLLWTLPEIHTSRRLAVLR